MDNTAWELLLPEGMLTYFEVSNSEKTSEGYIISLVEKPLMQGEFEGVSLSSKGFFDEVKVKDFPIRGKACYLKVKRRRWLNKETNKVVFRDWGLVAKGTRMTVELADFLKAINR